VALELVLFVIFYSVYDGLKGLSTRYIARSVSDFLYGLSTVSGIIDALSGMLYALYALVGIVTVVAIGIVLFGAVLIVVVPVSSVGLKLGIVAKGRYFPQLIREADSRRSTWVLVTMVSWLVLLYTVQADLSIEYKAATVYFLFLIILSAYVFKREEDSN